jgi:hypothetical protein
MGRVKYVWSTKKTSNQTLRDKHLVFLAYTINIEQDNKQMDIYINY